MGDILHLTGITLTSEVCSDIRIPPGFCSNRNQEIECFHLQNIIKMLQQSKHNQSIGVHVKAAE